MPETGSHYAAVLADLRARRAKLDDAIALVESLAGEAGVTEGAGTNEIRSDTFHNLSVPQAVKKYLGMTGKVPKSPNEIMAALEQGGQSQATYINVYSALKRLRSNGEVDKVASGDWGLADWYGGVKKAKGHAKDKKDAAVDDGEDQPE